MKKQPACRDRGDNKYCPQEMSHLEEELDTAAINNAQDIVEGGSEGGLRIRRNGLLWKAPSLSQLMGLFVLEQCAKRSRTPEL